MIPLKDGDESTNPENPSRFDSNSKTSPFSEEAVTNSEIPSLLKSPLVQQLSLLVVEKISYEITSNGLADDFLFFE